MNFYNELYPYIEYLHSIRKLKDFLSFDMKFPSKWVLPKSMLDEGQCVPYETNEEHSRGISFVTEIKNDSVDQTLFKISKIIKINKEKEYKEKLFKEYVEKLKTTFETTDIDKLKKLYFDFEEIPDLENQEYESDERESEIVELVGE